MTFLKRCYFYFFILGHMDLAEVVNTMGSGASSQVTTILSGPAGNFIYFGLGVLIIGIGIGIFRKFAGSGR